MKTILFVSHTSGFAGSERFLYDVVTHLNGEQYRAIVCCPRFGVQILPEQLQNNSSIRLSRLNFKLVISATSNIFRRVVNVLWQFVNMFQICVLIRREAVDVVVSNTSWVMIGALGAKIMRIPHIWIIHEDLPITKTGPRFILGNAFYKRLIGWLSSVVVFNSQWTMNQYSCYMRKVDQVIVYNGFEFLNNIKSECFRQQTNLAKKESIVIGVVGTIAPHKGQLEAVQAIKEISKKIPRSRLVLVGKTGDDAYYENLLKYIEDHRLKDKVTIEKFEVDIKNIYSPIDILLVPSYVEPFGRVVVEGIYYGCIVVASNVGGIPEIVNNGYSGYLLKDNKALTIANMVDEVLNNSFSLTNENRIKSLEKFALKSTMEEFHKILKSVCL